MIVPVFARLVSSRPVRFMETLLRKMNLEPGALSNHSGLSHVARFRIQ
jgi:hypothetical protein